MSKPEFQPTVYKRPTNYIFPYLPASWVPYAELMRIDRPGGFITFYAPCLFGISYATSIAAVQPPIALILDRSITAFLCCVLARGAACAWNDSVDRDFDRKVERCRLRPVARGAVTRFQSHLFAIGQTVVIILLLVRMPIALLRYFGGIVLLSTLYPFAKRFTYYPQIVLGSTFGVAFLASARSVDVDPMAKETLIPSICAFVANTLWSMIYDTIYAHQDVADDIHSGVKSMAVRFQDSTKLVTSILAIVMTVMLAMTGVLAGLGPLYFAFTVGGGAVSLAATIISVDLKDGSSCSWWFSRGYSFVGACILTGFLAESVSKSGPGFEYMGLAKNASWIHTEL
ncbi:UbiA prenyltransferase family-domain-containing protein [Penicillium cinerascens]|uniref:UbiA prenyltransferase family-domain-containing protein n=1 Tax=Penicillium cinerascens TaxID=70096 RepID=A0A9W9J6R4_9EURO|nr:UbiA prenyltransferase family-domain-containing protein [Penicillium cinerascens]KAJ5190251.1 UbiA prenyltransferase family-domain-containing protein [Penicillium cinerascens]